MSTQLITKKLIEYLDDYFAELEQYEHFNCIVSEWDWDDEHGTLIDKIWIPVDIEIEWLFKTVSLKIESDTPFNWTKIIQALQSEVFIIDSWFDAGRGNEFYVGAYLVLNNAKFDKDGKVQFDVNWQKSEIRAK